jgi:hypothetical protein
VAAGDIVNLVEGSLPDDYHCTCQYCAKAIGELKRPDGSYYSRNERREYYSKEETAKTGDEGGGHIAKTPLHVARWAIQRYTEPGDWVLDPTIGAGTTAVEALSQNRNVAGMELQFGSVLQANVQLTMERCPEPRPQVKLRTGDARTIGQFLDEQELQFELVVSNPPYSGDESQKGIGKKKYAYQEGLPNVAFLKEGSEYWSAMRTIYEPCIAHLNKGGHFVTGIKDMMRNKQPFLLHKDFCDLLADMGLTFVGTAVLRHYPGTQFINTYPIIHGIPVPLYQTINVFKKD